jgi:CheY-like chemotaxis protein
MKRILLIEDEESERIPLARMLRDAGFEVVTATDGKKGMALFKQQVIDLVITDLIMPTQDGIETIMALRSLKRDCKIIAVSGGGRMLDTGFLEKIIWQLGVKHFLEKPVNEAQMLAAVADMLDSAERPS